MENNRSVVKRLVNPVQRINKDYENSVCKKDLKGLISPVIQLENYDSIYNQNEKDISNNSYDSLVCPIKKINVKMTNQDNNVLFSDKHGVLHWNDDYSKKIYENTIFYDKTPQLEREQYRKKHAIEVNNILRSKTIAIKSDDGFINDFLFTECDKWFHINNPFIFIESGTGTGKTTFVENFINTYNLNALILTNRRIAKEQMKNRLGIEEVSDKISICSYHTLEDKFEIDVEFLDSFDVLILDEIHYWISDSLVNNYVNMSYLKILSTKKVMKIGLSATITNIREKIIGDLLIDNRDFLVTKSRIFNYYMQRNASIIKMIQGFSDWDELINEISHSEGKWLIFVDNIKKGKDLLGRLYEKENLKNQAVFINRKDYDRSNRDDPIRRVFDEIVQKNYFSCKICITTKMLDNSVNIKDTELKHMVIFEDDKTTFLQMLGRKRSINNNDAFHLYIPYGDRTSIARRRTLNLRFKEYMEKNYMYLQNNKYINSYIGKNGDDGNEYRKCIFVNTYRNSIEFNVLGYIKINCIIEEFEELLNTDIFKTKVKWILNHLNYVPIIMDQREKRFIDEIIDYINQPFNKGRRDIKLKINAAFKKQYGINDKIDKNESINLSRLQDKFNQKNVPLDIVETKRRFKLVKKNSV